MNSKSLIWLGMVVGSAVGSFIPTLWGDSFLSLSSVILSAVCAIIGIWVGYRLGDY